MTNTQQHVALPSTRRETWYGMTRQEVMIAEIRACLEHVGREVERTFGSKLPESVFLAMSQYATSFGRLAELRIFAARTWKRRRQIRRIQKQQEALLVALEQSIQHELARRLFGGTPTGSA